MTTFRSKTVAVVSAIAAVLGAESASSKDLVRADRILSAGQLEGYCSESENSQSGIVSQAHCLGVLIGISDATVTLNAAFRGKQTVCLTPADNAESMRLAFLSHLQRNAADRELPAATIVIVMLNTQYRCQELKK